MLLAICLYISRIVKGEKIEQEERRADTKIAIHLNIKCLQSKEHSRNKKRFPNNTQRL